MTWKELLNEALEECLRSGSSIESFQREAMMISDQHFKVHPTDEEVLQFRRKAQSFFQEIWNLHWNTYEADTYEWITNLLCDVFIIKSKRQGNYRIAFLLEKAERTVGRDREKLHLELDGFLTQVIYWGHYFLRDEMRFPELHNNIKTKINIVLKYINAW